MTGRTKLGIYSPENGLSAASRWWNLPYPTDMLLAESNTGLCLNTGLCRLRAIKHISTGWVISWRIWVGLNWIWRVPRLMSCYSSFLTHPSTSALWWDISNPRQLNLGQPRVASPCMCVQFSSFLFLNLRCISTPCSICVGRRWH